MLTSGCPEPDDDPDADEIGDTGTDELDTGDTNGDDSGTDTGSSDGHEPEDRDVRAPWQMDLERAIAKLPERARSVLVLYDVEGYSHAEIAELTGMAVGSSKAQLHRARKLVQEELEE